MHPAAIGAALDVPWNSNVHSPFRSVVTWTHDTSRRARYTLEKKTSSHKFSHNEIHNFFVTKNSYKWQYTDLQSPHAYQNYELQLCSHSRQTVWTTLLTNVVQCEYNNSNKLFETAFSAKSRVSLARPMTNLLHFYLSLVSSFTNPPKRMSCFTTLIIHVLLCLLHGRLPLQHWFPSLLLPLTSVVQGRSWVLESRGSNNGVVDERSPQAKFFFELHVAFGAFLWTVK